MDIGTESRAKDFEVRTNITHYKMSTLAAGYRRIGTNDTYRWIQQAFHTDVPVVKNVPSSLISRSKGTWT